MSRGAVTPPRAILFDLDGTLADTAPDLAAAANFLRRARGLPELPLAALRGRASQGARGLLWAALRARLEAPGQDALGAAFLARYERHMRDRSGIFPGVARLLDGLTAAGLPWGVVTNKAEALARRFIAPDPRLSRTCCLIGGDSTPWRKPRPEPIWAGLRALGREPGEALYVGDDRRDVAAARAAGCRAAVCLWGYGVSVSDPAGWGADFLLSAPEELLALAGLS